MDTIKANQIVHGHLAKTGDYENSPHLLPENIQHVRAKFVDMFKRTGIQPEYCLSNCLDLGCGTGFMYGVLRDIGLQSYIGIDVTTDMLDVCKRKFVGIDVRIGDATCLSFSDEEFTLITNYSFLDHLDNIRIVFEEAFRTLKAGGVFYSGLIPNADFSANLRQANARSCEFLQDSLRKTLSREMIAMFDNGSVYENKFGMDPEILRLAEPQKSLYSGLSIDALSILFKEVGFSRIIASPNWYYGQREHKGDPNRMKLIAEYLENCGSVSQQLFKYFDFFAIK